jgi:hypothetical protein
LNEKPVNYITAPPEVVTYPAVPSTLPCAA